MASQSLVLSSNTSPIPSQQCHLRHDLSKHKISSAKSELNIEDVDEVVDALEEVADQESNESSEEDSSEEDDSSEEKGSTR